MALTPNDVLNKQFATTKFREGYDQDEVDDFLDEVLAEFQRLTAENEALKAQVANAPEVDQSEIDALRAQVEEAKAEIARLQEELAEAKSAQNDGMNSAEYLQLARRVHEEHVREGVAKRDELIAQGESTAATTIAEAQAKAASLIADAQSSASALLSDARSQADTLVSTARQQAEALLSEAKSVRDNDLATLKAEVEQLEVARESLQTAVDGLQEFERSYRASLRAYLEGQLHDLDAVEAPVTGSTPAQEAPPTTGSTAAVAATTGEIDSPSIADDDAVSDSTPYTSGADAPTGDVPSLAASAFAPPSVDTGSTPQVDSAQDHDEDDTTTTTTGGDSATTGGLTTTGSTVTGGATTGGTTTSSPFPQYTQDDTPPAPGFGVPGSTDEPPRSPFSGFGGN